MEATDVNVGIEKRPIITSKWRRYSVRFHTSGLICGIAREKIAELVRGQPPPSRAAKCSNLRNIQNPGHLDAIHNNRPLGLSGPPIQIYHPAFATFIRESLDTTTTLTPETLDMARELINVSLEFHEDELRRKTELEKLEFWRSILSTDYASDSTVIDPDGSITVRPHGGRRTAIRIVELKNEIGEGKSDPIMQAERRYVSIFCSTGVGLFFFPISTFH